MAANYSQYTDHNEIGGVSVGLEDAKLAAADSVDEVTATDCVLMKDASGNPVKILKEDFNEAVRDALGSILSLNPLGTAIGKVAALGSSDNDLGSISTSDLASVLGVASIFGELETTMSSTLRNAPNGVWFVFSTAAFTDNPYPNGGNHCSVLIKVTGTRTGCILIDVEAVSDLFGIYVSYSGSDWKKLI